MKIAYLAAGAANMFCGSCLRDNALATALCAAGHEALLVPTYTPIRTDEPDVSQHRIFFGGINVYLQQKSALFRHTPWVLDRLLDAPALIRRLANKQSSVDASLLGDLTVSMIHGEEGRQRKELRKLVRWLKQEVRPDVVHLSNALMIGMAREIRRELGTPVICSLSGEDVFLDRLPEPHAAQAQAALRERAADADYYTSLNRYYAEQMIAYMGLEPARVLPIRIGLNLTGHGHRAPRPASAVRTMGYFSRICPDKGLHLLVQAFALLAADPSLPPSRLRVAGYLAEADRAYLAEQEAFLRERGLSDRFEYLGELDRPAKIAHLQSLDVLAAPTVYRESKGLSVVEAMANGVPVVVPAHGAFPELIADTGGGLLCEPGQPASVAECLKRLLVDPEQAERLGALGQAAVRDRYHVEAMARDTLALYERALRERRS